MGLQRPVKRRKKRTTNSQHDFPRYPNLVADLKTMRPDQAWVADITYVRLAHDFVYLAVLMDVFTRWVRGWHLSRSLDRDLTLTALRRALVAHAPDIHHSDQGWQYACSDYTDLLTEYEVQISMYKHRRKLLREEMDYNLDYPDEVIDIWSRVFEALSVGQFDLYWKDVGFPFPLPHDLQEIARNFVLAYLIDLGRSIPEQPSIQLRDASNPDDPLVMIWNNTFQHLQKLGYADTVYRWGKQTYRNYDGQNNPVADITTDWDGLLGRWTLDPTYPEFIPLDLPEQIVLKLQLIVIRNYAKSLQLRLRVEEVKQLRKNTWEQYAFEVLQVGSWLSNEARFVAGVAKWKTIFELLSDEEISMLEKWGEQQFEKMDIHRSIPLARFKLFANSTGF